MSKLHFKLVSLFSLSSILLMTGCQNQNSLDSTKVIKPQSKSILPSSSSYSIDQAISDNAQLSTIAFSGLAFMTGNMKASTFFPPGKVADFFGFQYMRDVDVAGYGHNTQFLTRVANNMLYILNDSQKEKIKTLAKNQASIYTSFGYNRFMLIDAFDQSLHGKQGLDRDLVGKYTSNLYKYDATLSYERAVMFGEIINSFTPTQKDYLSKMAFNNFNTWPVVGEDTNLKRGLTNTEYTAVMTYASELFSWYKGNQDADVYFCPERHGTYFGAFFLKDYPAINNPDYFISTSITSDKGKAFLNILNESQRQLITSIIPEQKTLLNEIVSIRKQVSSTLRLAQTGQTIDKNLVDQLIQRYGYIDGSLSALYAQRFSEVYATLTDSQKSALVALRDLNVTPTNPYLYAKEIPMPSLYPVEGLFGQQPFDQLAGNYPVPTGFNQKTPK